MELDFFFSFISARKYCFDRLNQFSFPTLFQKAFSRREKEKSFNNKSKASSPRISSNIFSSRFPNHNRAKQRDETNDNLTYNNAI